MAIDFSCTSCGQSYRVKDEFGGRSTKCKKCGSPLVVPKPAPPEPAATSSTGAWFDEELSVQAPAPKPAAPAAPLATTPRKTAPVPAAPKRGKIKLSLPSFGGSAMSRLGLGVLFSCVGALLGALLWAGVAVTAGRELGIIAWGVGLLAGGGMAIGVGDRDGTLSGILAAAVSLGGIVLAKFLIVMWVVASLSAGLKQEIVAGRLADEAFEKRGVDVETVNEEEFEAEYAKALESIEGMSDEELDRVYSESLGRMAANNNANRQPRPDAPTEPAQPPAVAKAPSVRIKVADEVESGSLAALLFSSLFRPIDGIFILMAFASAYKLGSGFGD
jgi:hypothetical protein